MPCFFFCFFFSSPRGLNAYYENKVLFLCGGLVSLSQGLLSQWIGCNVINWACINWKRLSLAHHKLWFYLLILSAGTLTMAGSMRLSARTKAPSSKVSSNMVAACVCSVLFMSCQDFKASGRRRLSTVSTMACVQQDKHTQQQKKRQKQTVVLLCKISLSGRHIAMACKRWNEMGEMLKQHICWG